MVQEECERQEVLEKSLNYLGRHTGEGQFAKTGKTCLSRDVQNHGAKRQRREFPSQDMIPCATLYILNQGGSQYTADFFFSACSLQNI